MDTSKFICEKCSQPIGSGETIIIQDKCYHKTCCECCICKKVPSVINIFQSKIYCPGCLSKHIGSLNMSHECNNMKDDTKCVCNKCLEQISDPLDKIVIGDKCFHKKCCECCICKEVPSVINIFQCQIYCAECLSKHILGSRNMNQENTKDDMKCVCNKCLEPISDPLDKIVIGAQCFHKKCCECCVCKKIPKFLRAYQCQIYCPECFTKCVLEKELKDFTNDDTTCVCQKCFEHISDPLDRIVIGNKCYHKKCCECSICRKNPTVIKAHQCQIYCQDCYNKHVFGEPTMGTGDSAKCMCERCLEPILDPLDKVVVGNKCYHKKCCECCVCKRLASVPRPYQCQMYCQECFNKLVLGHGWNRSPEQSQCLCDKCLAQILDPSDKIVIGNKCYHKKCCQCCVCKKVPTIIKVYQCQVFCPECFVKYIIGQGCRRNFRFWNNISMPTSYQYAMSRKLNEMMRSGCSKGPVILMTNDTECDVKFDGMHLPGCSKFCFPHAPHQLPNETSYDNRKERIVPKNYLFNEDEDKMLKNIIYDVKMSNKLKNIKQTHEKLEKLYKSADLMDESLAEYIIKNYKVMPITEISNDLNASNFLERPRLSNPGLISWMEEQLTLLELAAFEKKIVVPKCLWQHYPLELVNCDFMN